MVARCLRQCGIGTVAWTQSEPDAISTTETKIRRERTENKCFWDGQGCLPRLCKRSSPVDAAPLIIPEVPSAEHSPTRRAACSAAAWCSTLLTRESGDGFSGAKAPSRRRRGPRQRTPTGLVTPPPKGRREIGEQPAGALACRNPVARAKRANRLLMRWQRVQEPCDLFLGKPAYPSLCLGIEGDGTVPGDRALVGTTPPHMFASTPRTRSTLCAARARTK